MGLAFKCDRCGKYYDVPIHNKGKGLVECIFNKYGDIEQHSTGMIWCSKCMEAFEKFKTDFQMENRPTIGEILENIDRLPTSDSEVQVLRKYLPNIYKVIMLEKEEDQYEE